MALANNVPTEEDFQDLEQNLPNVTTNQQVELDYEPELRQEKEKNYCCDACGKRFTQSNSLKRHRKYSCESLETERLPKESCPGCGKMLHKTTVYKHKKMALRKKLIERLRVHCIAMADIINQSAENMNNLSEEEYKTTTDKQSLFMQAGIIASARSMNEGEETQVNEFDELELMKNLLKSYKASKEHLRNFAALGT